MHNPPNRKAIEEKLKSEYARLSEDMSSVIESLNQLGSTVAQEGEEEKRAEEYKHLKFQGSITQQQLKYVGMTIEHAEYCDFYINKNEQCHQEHIERFKQIESKIKPILEVKRDFLGVKNLTEMFKKTPLKLIEWGILLSAVKIFIQSSGGA